MLWPSPDHLYSERQEAADLVFSSQYSGKVICLRVVMALMLELVLEPELEQVLEPEQVLELELELAPALV